MSCPFVLIIPGYPMITQFQQIENTRFVTTLPNPSSIAELCFSVNPGIQIPDCGIALYYSFNPNEGWAILGTVTTTAPSGIFRTGWGTMEVERYSSVSIGISLESGDFVSNLKGIIQSPMERELPVMNVAQDLYNFMSSFGESQFGKIVLPADILDRWIDKTKKKLQMDPNYFYKCSVCCNKSINASSIACGSSSSPSPPPAVSDTAYAPSAASSSASSPPSSTAAPHLPPSSFASPALP